MAETVLPRAYGVGEINNYLREYLEEDGFLTDLLVRGELSSFKRHSSGHIYFTLSEGACALSGAMFRNQAALLEFIPEAGMEVVVWGSVGLYERDGRAQIYAKAFFPLGEGAAGQALTSLKQQLANEGLFSEETKQPLPLIPRSLGVITAANSAAWSDIQAVAQERWPGLPIKLYPALVQGLEAPESIAAALAKADKAGHSVLIVGRGGGASEDLAAFNTETVARAVAATRTPLISAVGHEIDLTLADLAADMRASTPSHAAALAVPEQSGLRKQLAAQEYRLVQALDQQLELRQRGLYLAQQRLERALADSLQQRRRQLQLLAARLETLSPLATLARGYAICRAANGQTLRNAADTRRGEQLSVWLAQGGLICTVEDTDTQSIREKFAGEE